MAAVWEETHTHNLRHKTPSFSSSLLDAIYRSIDDKDAAPHARKNAAQDIESLRRAIMIEKWISNTQPSHHFPSSAPDMTTRSPKREGRFAKANKTKAKEPVSPGGKIASFFNSIFSPRNLKPNDALEMRKSRSMKDAVKTSRSCLTKNVSCGGSKSKRSVRFWLVDEDCQQKSNGNSIQNLGVSEGGRRKGEDLDLDGMSCGSSDLFELDNIGREELPVYGTTDLQM